MRYWHLTYYTYAGENELIVYVRLMGPLALQPLAGGRAPPMGKAASYQLANRSAPAPPAAPQAPVTAAVTPTAPPPATQGAATAVVALADLQPAFAPSPSPPSPQRGVTSPPSPAVSLAAVDDETKSGDGDGDSDSSSLSQFDDDDFDETLRRLIYFVQSTPTTSISADWSSRHRV